MLVKKRFSLRATARKVALVDEFQLAFRRPEPRASRASSVRATADNEAKSARAPVAKEFDRWQSEGTVLDLLARSDHLLPPSLPTGPRLYRYTRR